ncbi:6544_t:CDS:2, partial [Cetraspora pellucida]
MSLPLFSDTEESITATLATSTASTENKNNPDFAYCKICELNLVRSWQKPYLYTRKGGNTSNMIAHLRDKHNIIKDNYTDYLDEHNEPKCDQTKVTNYFNHMVPLCLPHMQQLIARKLIQFIIQFVEPLYILQDESFCKLIYICVSVFRMPYNKTVKSLIYEAYNWTHGITVTWLSSDFKFQEALLSCDHLAYLHTGETISKELLHIIHEWRLEAIVFAIATDNDANIVKGINLLHENYFNNIVCQLCTTYTLQLSVKEGLKQCKSIHHHVKSLQAQHLREAQCKFNISEDSQNTVANPFDVLTDVKTSAKYSTLNLVYPCMEILKKGFAPETGETVDTYLNLIYEEAENDDNESDETSDDDIPVAGTCQQWQYAYRQFRQRMIARGRGHRQNRRMPRRSNNEDLEDIDKVEDLLPVSTTGLLNRVRAAIYLLMDELWSVLSDNALVVTFFDPRFKHFKWATIPDDIEEGLVDRSYSNDDDFFQDLKTNSAQTNMKEEDE